MPRPACGPEHPLRGADDGRVLAHEHVLGAPCDARLLELGKRQHHVAAAHRAQRHAERCVPGAFEIEREHRGRERIAFDAPVQPQLANGALARHAVEALEQATHKALDLRVGVEHVRIAREQPCREHGTLDDRLGGKGPDDIQRFEPRRDIG
jgi:ribosomal protein L16/L10AE